MSGSRAEAFTVFAKDAGARLRQALIARYGPDVGLEATAEALAYGWEKWDVIEPMDNAVGYLYRVAQTKARRVLRRPAVTLPPPDNSASDVWIEPGLPAALQKLSPRQQAAVILVHGYGWTVTEVAELWGVGFSTVQSHLDRALSRLQTTLGVEVVS